MFPLFIDGDNISNYQELNDIIKRQCGPMYEHYLKKHHKVNFDGLDLFLRAAGFNR